jgi:hypothetical protein
MQMLLLLFPVDIPVQELLAEYQWSSSKMTPQQSDLA